MFSYSSSSHCAVSLNAHSSRRSLSLTARHLKPSRARLTLLVTLLIASLLVSSSFFGDSRSAEANTAYTDIISITGTGTFDPPICTVDVWGTGTFSMGGLAVGAQHALKVLPFPITGDEVALTSGISASGPYDGLYMIADIPLSGSFGTWQPLPDLEHPVTSSRFFSVDVRLQGGVIFPFPEGNQNWNLHLTTTPFALGPGAGGCTGVRVVLIEGTLTHILGD